MRQTLAVAVILFLIAGCTQDHEHDQRSLEKAEQRLEEVREQAEEQLSRAQERLEEARERIQDATQEVREESRSWSDDAEREAGRALRQTGFAEALGQVMEDVGQALQDESEVNMVSEEDLRDLLPKELLGLKRYDTNAETSGQWGIHVSHAKGKYRNDRGDEITVAIVDPGTLRGLLSRSTDLLDASGYKHSDRGYSRATRIEGHPVKISRESHARRHEFQAAMVVSERFVVVVEAESDAFDDDFFEDVFDQINLRKLSRMAE
ncbi:MAG: vacuolar-type H+-ATPase subunit H [Rhodothermales bacterium]|jgi:vacuolar-type H+-ATPase subunit H